MPLWLHILITQPLSKKPRWISFSVLFDYAVIKINFRCPRELGSVGRNVVYYIQGLGFELQTPHLFTFMKWISNIVATKKVIILDKLILQFYLKKLNVNYIMFKCVYIKVICTININVKFRFRLENYTCFILYSILLEAIKHVKNNLHL